MSRRAYPTDLTDAQWAILEPLVPTAKPDGRPPRQDRRELVNAMLYVLRAGEAWRMLPHDVPPWQTVSHSFQRWVVERTFAWLGRHRRLSKDDEELPGTEEDWIDLAMTRLMLVR